MHTNEMVDAVVVGSGFGGSVSAYRVATDNKSVVVLERGRRYPPGSFPTSPAGLARNETTTGVSSTFERIFDQAAGRPGKNMRTASTEPPYALVTRL